ncbi:unnamed protein product [Phytomonas sp. EM1]|nr:unnamed protein product [Phytomonas sp. EM1]|eukprot:CCW63669.1 unnamed protein product [Phytomonas sp. isolate EM1]
MPANSIKVTGSSIPKGIHSSSKSPSSHTRSLAISSRKTNRSSGEDGKTSLRNEVSRRAQDLKRGLEAAIHVLDNGVNRTPLPLHQQRTLTGLRVGGMKRALSEVSQLTSGIYNELGSSCFQSSFLNSSSSGNIASHRGSENVSLFQSSGVKSMESSMIELPSMRSSLSLPSITNDTGSQPHKGPIPRPKGIDFEGNENASLSMSTSKYVASAAVFGGAAFSEKTLPMTEQERRAWVNAKTTITLSETPTFFLYAHADEAVSNEDKEEVAIVLERNKALERLEEAYRLDENTRFQSKGTITFTKPMKSIHCEVKPVVMKDSGALQVTPWMLKDVFAPLQDDDDDVEEHAAYYGGKDAEPNSDDEEKELLNGMDTSPPGSSGNANLSERTDPSTTFTGAAGVAELGGAAAADQWMLSESLPSTLRVMERAVVQNIMERLQMAYRGIEMTPQEGARLPPITRRRSAMPPKGGRTTSAFAELQFVGGSPGSTAVDEAARRNPTPGEGVPTGEVSPKAEAPPRDLPELYLSGDITTLWRYHSPLTQGRSVNCMAWNRKQTDVLAVGYGVRRVILRRQDHDDPNANPTPNTPHPNTAPLGAREDRRKSTGFPKGGATTTTKNGGLVCFWSLKNPLAPELVLELANDVEITALAFSFHHPSLLAVGDSAGGIVVYDILKDTVAPSIVPAVSTGLHTGAVWELKWVPGGKEHGEFLMSTSADGRVVQWVVGKAVERVAPDLMHLKRRPGAQAESVFVEGVDAADDAAGYRRRRKAAEDAVLSHQAGGMCFDVCPTDHAVYLVGTEDGSIFQCKKSQTEVYDLDYAPHSELVYRIAWSPFSSKYFLTCSADWTTRLYEVGHTTQRLTFDSANQDAVQNVAWSYSNALVFATVSGQGNLEVWSILDNIYPRATVQFEDRRRLKTVLFAEQETPVILVGDDAGDVTVFLLKNPTYGRQDLTDEEQENWLDEAVQKQIT